MSEKQEVIEQKEMSIENSSSKLQKAISSSSSNKEHNESNSHELHKHQSALQNLLQSSQTEIENIVLHKTIQIQRDIQKRQAQRPNSEKRNRKLSKGSEVFDNDEKTSNKYTKTIRSQIQSPEYIKHKYQYKRSRVSKPLTIKSNVVSVFFGANTNINNNKIDHQQQETIPFKNQKNIQIINPQLFETLRSSTNWTNQFKKGTDRAESFLSEGSVERMPGKFRSRSLIKSSAASRSKSNLASRKSLTPTIGKQFKFVKFQRLPNVENTEQQLQRLAVQVVKMFGITQNYDLQVKKYKNCVCYKIQGFQIIWYYQGNFYFGEFSNSESIPQKNGFGIQINPSKFVYQGSFRKGSKEGYGRIRYINNDYYEGEWLRGIKNGEGILINRNQDKYQGMFLNGMRHGYGKQSFKNGDIYNGTYKHNKFQGQGYYEWANGSIYKGQFMNGLRCGFGQWKSKKNPPYDQYAGFYLNGKKNGKGIYKWANGSSYDGEFLDDLKHGEGIMRFPSGKVIRALWQYGLSRKKLYCQQQEKYKQSKRVQSVSIKYDKEQHQQSPLPYPNPPKRKRSFSKCIQECG